MPQYLLSMHTVDGEDRAPMTDEEMQHSWAQISALNEELKSAGAWVFAGALHPPETATVVRMSDGEVLTTDGPFVEAKEHYPFHATRADLLRRLDRNAEAGAAYERAAAMAPTDAERDFLRRGGRALRFPQA